MDDFKEIKGVGKTTASKLRKGGYSTIRSIAESEPRKFSRDVAITLSLAKRIIESAKDEVLTEKPFR